MKEAQVAEASERPSVNRASRDELIEAGVLPGLASRIVAFREAYGPIRDENELYLLVRDNETRLDQLLVMVALEETDADPRGYR